MSFLYSEFDRNLSDVAPLAGRKNDLTLSAISYMEGVSVAGPEPEAVGNLNFYVPAETYGAAETCHAAILHHWMNQMILNPTTDQQAVFKK